MPGAAAATASDRSIRLLVERCVEVYAASGREPAELRRAAVAAVSRATGEFRPEGGVSFAGLVTRAALRGIRAHVRDSPGAADHGHRPTLVVARIPPVAASLTRRLGRSPTAREVAARLGCSVELVVESLDRVGSGGRLTV